MNFEQHQNTPGSLYRPANGTEECCFFMNWCERCQRDKVMNGTATIKDADKDSSLYCDILNRLFTGRYIPEWVYDSNGEPCCTEFLPNGEKP